MKKFLGLAVVIALLSFVSVAQATVAIEEEFASLRPTYVGEATTLNIKGQDVSTDGSRITILANGHKDGVTDSVSTESNLETAELAYGVIRLQYGLARSIALGNGTAGQMITIITTGYDAGAITITDDEINAGVFTMTNTGWDDIVLDADLDVVTLLYLDDTYGWVYIGGSGVTIT